MTDRHPLGPLGRRPADLVTALLGFVYESDDPVPWLELAGRFSEEGAYPMKTVENVLYELVALGALHRVGKPGHTRVPDTRALRPTALGRAWLERDLLPLPGAHTDHEPDELDVDAYHARIQRLRAERDALDP